MTTKVMMLFFPSTPPLSPPLPLCLCLCILNNNFVRFSNPNDDIHAVPPVFPLPLVVIRSYLPFLTTYLSLFPHVTLTYLAIFLYLNYTPCVSFPPVPP